MKNKEYKSWVNDQEIKLQGLLSLAGDIDIKCLRENAPRFPEVIRVEFDNRLLVGSNVYVRKEKRVYYSFLFQTSPNSIGFDKLKERFKSGVSKVTTSGNPGEYLSLLSVDFDI